MVIRQEMICAQSRFISIRQFALQATHTGLVGRVRDGLQFRAGIAAAHDTEPNAGARIHAAAFFGCVRLRFKASIRLMGFSPRVLQRLGLG